MRWQHRVVEQRQWVFLQINNVNLNIARITIQEIMNVVCNIWPDTLGSGAANDDADFARFFVSGRHCDGHDEIDKFLDNIYTKKLQW